jgi:VIT1/CCC1 family predicted Fe2+/Mn2+ transporter
MYPRMIRQAEAEGRQDAIAAFRLAFDGETRHARLFEQAFDRLQASGRIVVPIQPVQPLLVPGQTDAGTPPSAESAPAVGEVSSEKQRVAGLRRIREVVFGAQDGIVSSVAVAVTVMTATQGNTSLAIVAGLASAMAGTVSMAAGTYLGSRAANEMEQAELEMEWRELIRHPEEERAEFVSTYRHDGYSLEEAETMADRLMADRQRALQVMAERELGISPDATVEPRKDAAVMAAAYVVGGIIPVLPYLMLGGTAAIVASVSVSLVALAAVGIVKARTAHRSVVPSVLEVTGIGAAAGVLGYFLGEVLPGLFGL